MASTAGVEVELSPRDVVMLWTSRVVQLAFALMVTGGRPRDSRAVVRTNLLAMGAAADTGGTVRSMMFPVLIKRVRQKRRVVFARAELKADVTALHRQGNRN